ncbi:MAG TPA: hypothetical protein VH437_24900 [Terriglobales bacterium]|jgi:hypothetical protein
MLQGRYLCATFLFCVVASLAAQQGKPGVLGGEEIKKLAPTTYYFAGQSAPVQTRNTVGFRSANGKVTLAGFVDTSGYAADIQQKYQGLFITETKLDVGGSQLGPGEYGFGFTKDGKFIVMNVAAEDILTVSSQTDEKLARPVPLKIAEDGAGYKLYAGRQWVGLKAE